MSDNGAGLGGRSTLSLHKLGVFCGLAAAVWLGTAEAPTKLVNAGFSPILISMGMVMGAFVARWTVPTLLKGTDQLFADLRDKPHLIVWALMAGMLWAVANTLTIYAVRNVGLAIAFPLWNTNSLVGLFWACLLFKELRGSGFKGWSRVVGGASAIVGGAAILAYATARQSDTPGKAAVGIVAALGAGVLLGTMYIPYRKAYISGMNPLSFVTIFTFGELGTILTIGLFYFGGVGPVVAELHRARPMLFWPFLGGFCWVIGDLFQNFAAKYIGIGRGIPLSNTNQLWGLAWGALVFTEFSGLSFSEKALIVTGSLVMIAGAISISMADPGASELGNWRQAMLRECDRYNLDYSLAIQAYSGLEPGANRRGRAWWDYAIAAAAIALFVYLGLQARAPELAMNMPWLWALVAILIATACAAGWALWKATRFA